MITADADYLIEGSTVKYRYSTTKILCPFAVDKDDVTTVDVQVWNTAGDAFYGSTTLRFSESELEAYSSGESGEFSVFKNVVEQAVAAGRIRAYGIATWTGLRARPGDRGRSPGRDRRARAAAPLPDTRRAPR